MASQRQTNKLGILVEPTQVRLRPNPDDPYTWESINDNERLFSKNISDHSVGALKELYREVGITFEAVVNEKAPESGATASINTYPHCLKGGSSFSSKINELQNRLTIQMDELERWQCKASSEAEVRRQAEIKLTETEGASQALRRDNERLETEVSEWKLRAEQSRSKVLKYDKATEKIRAYVEEMRPEI